MAKTMYAKGKAKMFVKAAAIIAIVIFNSYFMDGCTRSPKYAESRKDALERMQKQQNERGQQEKELKKIQSKAVEKELGKEKLDSLREKYYELDARMERLRRSVDEKTFGQVFQEWHYDQNGLKVVQDYLPKKLAADRMLEARKIIWDAADAGGYLEPLAAEVWGRINDAEYRLNCWQGVIEKLEQK